MLKNIKDKKVVTYIAIATVVAVAVILLIIYFVFFAKSTKVNLGNDGDKVSPKFEFLVKEESTLVEDVNILGAQDAFMKDILAQYKKGNYTLEKPFVFENPFLITQQTALVMFKTKKKEQVTVTIKGKHDDDLVTTYEAAKDHFLPIYGLYGDYKNELLIETESGEKNTIYIDIEGMVETNKLEVLQNDVKNNNGEFYFTTSALGSMAMAYDNYGEIRWWLDMGYGKGMTMLSNGHMLLSNISPGPDFTSTGGVVEIDMMGYVHHEYYLEGGYHHDALELENGNLIILTTDVKGGTSADYIVELDRQTGKVVRDWKLKEIVDAIDPDQTAFYPTWGWINSVTYDKTSNSLILSVRNQNSVISIGYDSKQINWILGDKKYWSKKFDKYLIKGVGSDFIYPLGQHSVNITKEGYLSIFNNGYDAHDEQPVSCKSLRNNASYAMVYDLDLARREAKMVWKFGGKEYFSYALSSFTYAKDNHKVFNSGWHFTDEVKYDSPTCTQFSNDKYDTYVIEFDENNKEIVKLHIFESKFEVVKAPIYNLGAVSVKPNEDTIVKNYGVSSPVTTFTEHSLYEELTEEEALKYATNEALPIALYILNGELSFNLVTSDNSTVKVTLIAPDGKAYRYLVKDKDSETFSSINIYGLPKGRYYIYVDVDGKVYNSLQHFII